MPLYPGQSDKQIDEIQSTKAVKCDVQGQQLQVTAYERKMPTALFSPSQLKASLLLTAEVCRSILNIMIQLS